MSARGHGACRLFFAAGWRASGSGDIGGGIPAVQGNQFTPNINHSDQAESASQLPEPGAAPGKALQETSAGRQSGTDAAAPVALSSEAVQSNHLVGVHTRAKLMAEPETVIRTANTFHAAVEHADDAGWTDSEHHPDSRGDQSSSKGGQLPGRLDSALETSKGRLASHLSGAEDVEPKQHAQVPAPQRSSSNQCSQATCCCCASLMMLA